MFNLAANLLPLCGGTVFECIKNNPIRLSDGSQISFSASFHSDEIGYISYNVEFNNPPHFRGVFTIDVIPGSFAVQNARKINFSSTTFENGLRRVVSINLSPKGKNLSIGYVNPGFRGFSCRAVSSEEFNYSTLRWDNLRDLVDYNLSNTNLTVSNH